MADSFLVVSFQPISASHLSIYAPEGLIGNPNKMVFASGELIVGAL